MITKEQLIKRALQKNGVPGAGQTPSAEDVALINDIIARTMADLATRDIYAWGDPDEYDDDASEHLAGILANATAVDFGKPFDPALQEYLESRLRQLNLYVLSGQPQTVEFY